MMVRSTNLMSLLIVSTTKVCDPSLSESYANGYLHLFLWAEHSAEWSAEPIDFHIVLEWPHWRGRLLISQNYGSAADGHSPKLEVPFWALAEKWPAPMG